ncbi:Advillin like protein [Apiospora arundinis]|uniref:Advillin like protein n=1 Tax=Apiospora arundinis TaxID=335852 RepID=A0ABR2J6W4_9PEZI
MSEDVSKFLSQVRELGDRHAEEDEARSRELEEKILQDRKERQARRAERARSISPQKSSPANTPPPSTQRTATQGSERLNLESSPILEPPGSPQTPRDLPPLDSMFARGSFSTSPSKENESPFDGDNKQPAGNGSPTRSSTVRGLSWQQRRPQSQASNRPQSRPLSVVAAENAARSSTSLNEALQDSEDMSRDQIAQSLSSKDPAWFRQTADRGSSSGAYRKNQVEDDERTDMTSPRTQLPGMSRGISNEAISDGRSPRPESLDLRRGSDSPHLLLAPQKLTPPTGEEVAEAGANEERESLMSPSLGRGSPTRSDRPVSPTKGMGGFVQSAMMKRNDSISKRWSVQSTTGLQRADSVVSNRTGQDQTTPRARPKSMMRETSTDPHSRPSSRSRPTSSYGREEAAEEEPISSKVTNSLKLNTKPSPEPSEPNPEKTPPETPSKTSDPRRWSPTKASWLESALNKPESPKPKPTSTPSNQPAWMAEIAKAKAQKATNSQPEVGRSNTVSHKHEVSIGGLSRSFAPGIAAKPTTPTVVSHRTGGSTPKLVSQRTGGDGGFRHNSTNSTTTAEEGSAEAEPASKPKSPPVPVNKPRSDTLPTRDFRAGLKPRQAAGGSFDASGNPEFKNVFGHLRKATTQNYVAPDELKNNITRGKAALNVTGGPKKTERVDEFKEAILAKKKEFQQTQTSGRGISRNASNASENPIPEGLAKSLELARSKSIKSSSPAFGEKAADREKAVSIPDLLARRASRIGLEKSVPASDPLFRKSSQAGLDANQESPKPAPLARNVDDGAATPALQKETSAPGRLQGKIGGGLANRFNPALAGLLARGPPPMASGNSNSGGSASQSSASGADNGEGASGPKLTHMTKGRARGPRRKAPTTVVAPAAAQQPMPEAAETQKPSTPQLESTSPREIGKEDRSPILSPKPDVKSPVNEPARPSYMARRKSIKEQVAAFSAPKSPEPDVKSPVNEPIRPSYMARRKSIKEQVAAFAAPRSPSPTKRPDESEGASQPSSPRKLNVKRMSRFLDESKQDANKSPQREALRSPEVEDTPKPLFSKPSSPELKSPPLASPSRPLPEPVPSPKRVQPAEPEKRFEPEPARGMFGARPLPTSPQKQDTRAAKPVPTPLDLDFESRGSSRPLPNPQVTSPPLSASASPMRSPSKHAAETSSALTDFFGTQRPKRDYRADAAELLMHRPSTLAPQIRTLDTQLFQLSADGKKVAVRAGHERHLFEGEMYLCSHTFNNENGKKTSEVYFWAGCEVPGPIVEDASIFVSREARSIGGNLIKFRQGKETPEFLAALGGIVITQRGSSMKYDSLAPRILCGRRYIGQIVFDEMDFVPVSLCSGFPYLITTSGRCYLWKGKGSGVDELSCARLVGMEYALSGELEEIDDGHEPDNFWGLFEAGTAAKAGSADHWRLKPNYEKYCSRLFMSDAASKQQIIEICPFSQSDLQSTSVYVLDAFFELYIIVGKRAQSQYASFHNALDFAQEYAILAAGMEDRPFVPISTVVLEGIPRDMKSVFRKWQDADSPTLMPPPTRPGLRRGRSLRVLPLNQALQAMSE